MSMNLFFLAYTQKQINEMMENNKLIDESVEAENYLFSTDIETAWDVLRVILGGIGIDVGKDINDALFNGCALLSNSDVKAQALELSKWTKEKVLEGLHSIEDSELYRLAIYQEDQDDLLEQFEKMVSFYNEAAEKNLGAVSYAA